MHRKQLAALFSCLFLIGSAEVVAGPMMAFMGPHFGVAPAKIAYLPAAYGLAYAVVALLAGPFSDRFGRRRPLQAGLCGFALFGALVPSAPHLTAAVALSALTGVCAAIIQPNALSLVGDEAPADQVGRLIGRVFIGLMLAFVLTPAMAGWLADTAGWQSAYYLLSGAAVVVLWRVSAVFPQRVRSARTAALAFGAAHRHALSVPGAVLRLSASYLWLGWVAGFGAVVAAVCARKLALSPTDAGLLAGFYGAAVIAGNMSNARLHRLLGDRALPLMALVSAAGILAFLLPLDAMVPLALAGFPWAFGYGCAGPLHHARLSALSDRYRGTINSYHASLLNLGIFSVSFTMGQLASAAALPVFYLVVSGVGILGALLLCCRRPGPVSVDPLPVDGRRP
ncbi:MFS transporter [Sphingomonas sp. NCPPB 2930]